MAIDIHEIYILYTFMSLCNVYTLKYIYFIHVYIYKTNFRRATHISLAQKQSYSETPNEMKKIMVRTKTETIIDHVLRVYSSYLSDRTYIISR